MKSSHLFVAITTVVLVTVFSSYAGAQNGYQLNANAASLSVSNFLEDASLTIGSDVRKDINIKAVRHFKKNYAAESNETWTKLEDGFVARFLNNGIENAVYYNTNGKWIADVRSYGEENLPADIRTPVRISYYDYNITHVTEVQYYDVKVYLIQVKNKTSFKILRMFDGELEVVNEYKNAGL